MGWNGSGGEKSSASDQNKTVKKPSWLKRGVLAGLVIAFCGGIIAFVIVLSESEDQPKIEEETRKGKIQEATPSIRTNVSEVVVTNTPIAKEEETYVDEAGIKRYKGGQRVFDKSVPPAVRKHLKRRKIFAHNSEAMIGDLISIKPGTLVFGQINYDAPWFKKDLSAALIEKVEFTDKDTPEDRELKKAVQETKDELVKRLKAGEDPIQILCDSRRELQRLGQIKEDLRREMLKLSFDEQMSDADMGDFIKAANLLLESKGISPLKQNPVTARALRRQFQNKKQEETK